MSDPFEPLRHTDRQVPHLPADEVRRLGDRRRARRTVLRSAAAALAVAAVIGGGVVGSGLTTSTAPAPAPAGPGPSPQATSGSPGPLVKGAEVEPTRTDIPADFPLGAGWPADYESEPTFADVTACDRVAEVTSEPVDELSYVFQQPEDYRARKLAVYPTAQEAAVQMAAILDVFEACPRQEWDEASPSMVTHVFGSTLGSEGATVVRGSEFEGTTTLGIEVIEVVRVANALLLTSEANEGMADPEGSRLSRQHSLDQAAPVVEAMCVFDDQGCVAQPVGVLDLDDVIAGTPDLTTSWHHIDQQGRLKACEVNPPGTVMENAERAGLVADFTGLAGKPNLSIENARLASALAVHADERAAAEAFQQAIADIDGCVQTGPAETMWDAVEGNTEHGPTYWELSYTPAPGVCTECGTVWLQAQGVVLVGDKVAAVTLSWIGDLEMYAGGEASGPLPGLLERAAAVAARS